MEINPHPSHLVSFIERVHEPKNRVINILKTSPTLQVLDKFYQW